MRKRKKRRGRKLLLLIIIALLAFAIYNSAYNIEVTQYTVENEKLPAEFDGFRIVQISDYHGADFSASLGELVRNEKPDIIAVTGDAVTDAEDIPRVEALLSELQGTAPIYFVSGNHDFGSGEIEKLGSLLEEYGVRYLKNEYLSIEKNGARIILAGVEDPNSWAEMPSPQEVMMQLRSEYPENYAVLLGHRNYWASEYPQLPADLILCGHAHGGLIRLPGVGGLIGTDRTLFPEYDAGLYRCAEYDMIVSRGIGNSVPVPRLFNRPELVSVVLKAG